jgi:hypothetical protein
MRRSSATQELEGVQSGVQAAAFAQLVMGTSFNDPAPVEHEDHIGFVGPERSTDGSGHQQRDLTDLDREPAAHKGQKPDHIVAEGERR